MEDALADRLDWMEELAHGHRILGKTEMALQHKANWQQFAS